MERTAFQLAQMLRTARTLAITQGHPIQWFWDSQAQQASLVVQQTDGSMAAVSGRFGQPQPIPTHVELSVVQSGQPVTQIDFFPDGTSQTTSLLIGDTSASRYHVALDGPTSQVVVH